jgi:ribosomal protein S27AE
MQPNTCPRCGEGIPNNLQRGQYPGALSRTDNKTEICSDCGTQEALEDFFTQNLTPKTEWSYTK